MVFSNLTFVCLFLPAVLVAYFLGPKSWRNGVLVVASVIFYAWGGPIALVLIGISIAANFAVGLKLDEARGAERRRILITAVAGNLLVLIVFKYANFIIENVNDLLALLGARQLPNPRIPLPLGISFFTFHILSYLIDIYRGTAQPQRSAMAFTLYIINFPQLVAGPIIRYRPIADQLTNRPVTFSDLDAGVARFAAGLAKKLLIANPIGAIADQIFGMSPADLPVYTLWLGVACYALQIYFDFSGYSDMAIGLARMFGFRFPENFNYPYSATSIQDFWRRWHISLSLWFRDYLYVPLGGSREGFWKTVRNLWIVFLLVGAWHGAAWNFIVWGAWYGLFLSLERIPLVAAVMEKTPLLLRHGYVLIVVLVGWVFFRAASLELAIEMLARMFGLTPGSEVTLPLSAHLSAPMGILIAVAVIFSFPVWPKLRDWLATRSTTPSKEVSFDLARAGYVAAITILCLGTMTVEQHNPFIYFRF